MLINRPEFKFIEQIERNPGQVEAEIFSRILMDALYFGDFTVEIVKHTWLNHLFRAESEVYNMFDYGYRMSGKRLEAACRRAIFYGQTSTTVVKTIMLERLDTLSLDHGTDIYGQYTLF
jgi:hypothetical protein